MCRCHGAWHSSMTGSWLPGTTAERPGSPTKWLAIELPSLWTTEQEPLPFLKWDRPTVWRMSTLSPPRSLSLSAWASDSTKLSSTVASLLSKFEKKKGQRRARGDSDYALSRQTVYLFPKIQMLYLQGTAGTEQGWTCRFKNDINRFSKMLQYMLFIAQWIKGADDWSPQLPVCYVHWDKISLKQKALK